MLWPWVALKVDSGQFTMLLALHHFKSKVCASTPLLSTWRVFDGVELVPQHTAAAWRGGLNAEAQGQGDH